MFTFQWRPNLLTLALMLCFVPVLPTPALSAEKGFDPLFNGRDLKAWEGDNSLWTVRDGAIVATGKASGKTSGLLICSIAEFCHFELRFSFKANNATAGVVCRARRSKQSGGPETVSGGFEAQLVNADVSTSGQSEWKECVIIAHGNVIKHQINGIPGVLAHNPTPTSSEDPGIIAFTAQLSPNSKIEIRDVRIRALQGPKVQKAGSPATKQRRPQTGTRQKSSD